MSKKGFFKLRLQIRKRMTHTLIRFCIKTFPPQENKGISCRHIPLRQTAVYHGFAKGCRLHCKQASFTL